MTRERAITLSGVGTALALLGGLIAIVGWLGFSPTNVVTRQEVDAAFERLESKVELKEHAKEIHDRLGEGMKDIENKLDALLLSNAKAQAKYEELERARSGKKDE